MIYHVFNASHDEALASGNENFTLPAAARHIDNDLALLPYWYASSGECVLVPHAAEARDFTENLPVKRNVAIADDFSGAPPSAIEPWGWNALLVRMLEKRGVPRQVMPDNGFLQLVRRLQSRETVSEYLPVLLQRLRTACHDGKDVFSGESHFVRTLDELHETPAFISGRYIMKKPWSGSGRGIFAASGADSERADKWCAAAIREQGGAEVQALLENHGDCAAEFHINPDGTASLTGYSYFSTAGKGAYAGNTVKPHVENDIRLKLGPAAFALDAAVSALSLTLPEILRGYSGPVGVDMMICRNDNENGYIGLFPCVEINLRCTMGMVAAALTPLIAPGSTGRYLILYERLPEDMKQRCHALAESQPLATEKGKILQGYLPLTPVNAETHFHACLTVEHITEEK